MYDELIENLAGFSADPLGFVYFSFPWGEPGELAAQAGPVVWQIELLLQLGEGLITIDEAILLARTSGHGIGKSALVAWLILWAISTMEDTKGVVTANTENQLKTKTWAEVAKWHRLFIGRELFKLTATALFSCDPLHEKTWRIDMIPWSEKNTEAFAGLHNAGKRIIIVFDEASAIPDIIFEVTEGALTDLNTEIIWAVFGNPTKNKGRFRECFAGGKFAHRWRSAAIDSRSVPFTNQKQMQDWIDDYGEDSDFVRVRILGKFPRVDAVSFISYDMALEASKRDALPGVLQSGIVTLGVDVARFGDDASVIYPRCGRDAKSRKIEVYYGLDTMTFAGKVAAAAAKYATTSIMVDGGGVGGGVVDRLRQLGYPVIDVQFGGAAEGTNTDDSDHYANKRAEIWGAVRGFLKDGCVPGKVEGCHVSLVDELTGPTYSMVTRKGREAILLESKVDMRRRGEASPNIADALACTFAYPVYDPGIRLPDVTQPGHQQMPEDNPYEGMYS